MNAIPSRPRRVALWLTAVLLALPLAVHFYAGRYNRPLVDDFCLTVEARDRGLIGALDHWYNAWTGTYSSTFFQSVIGLAELWHFTPIFLMFLWVLALTWALYQMLTSLYRIDERADRLPLALCLTFLLLNAIINSTLNVYQSLYWTSGAITYSLPLIVLTFNLGLVVRTVRRSVEVGLEFPALGLIAGSAMLAGGFSPLFSVVHVALWFFVLVGCWLFLPKGRRRAGMMTALVGLIFAGIAFLIVLIAPGNDIRRARFETDASLGALIEFNFREVERFLERSTYWLAPLLAFGAVSVWVRLTKPEIRPRHWWSVGLIAFLIVTGGVLIFCGYFTGVYAMNYAPPPRSEIVMRTTLLSVLCAVGWLGGSLSAGLFRPRGMRAAGAILSVGIAVYVGTNVVSMTSHTLDEARDLAIYAQEWDALKGRLDAAFGDIQAEIVLEPFTVDFARMARLDPISERPEANACLREYYRVGSVRAAE